MTDFEETKQKFWDDLAEGKTIDCPCCNRFSHINRFKINKSMILAACSLLVKSQASEDGFVHHSVFLDGFSRGFYDLVRWDMIEPRQKDASEVLKKTSGYWKLKQKGVDFLSGEITVPKYAFVFDNIVRGYSSDLVNVHDAMKENFDFQETLSGVVS